MDYETGSMDGAYKGRLHVVWPFIGRKTLTERHKEPHEMIVMKMMRTFVLCVVTNAPPQFVGSARRGIALNVLTLAPVGMKLCILHHNFAQFLYIRDLPMLQYTLYYFLGTQS